MRSGLGIAAITTATVPECQHLPLTPFLIFTSLSKKTFFIQHRVFSFFVFSRYAGAKTLNEFTARPIVDGHSM